MNLIMSISMNLDYQANNVPLAMRSSPSETRKPVDMFHACIVNINFVIYVQHLISISRRTVMLIIDQDVNCTRVVAIRDVLKPRVGIRGIVNSINIRLDHVQLVKGQLGITPVHIAKNGKLVANVSKII
jgi:hypothetical protein